MTNLIPDDLKKLLPHWDDRTLPHVGSTDKPWKGPLYWLWVFDPLTGDVTLEHNDDRPRAEAVTHDEMRPDVTHSGREEGYVYKIEDGYRITTWDHKVLHDPFVKKQVETALEKANPGKPPGKIDA